jgi:hypothetical protein
MSRAGIERSLKIERASEHRNRSWAGVFATYITAEVVLTGSTIINEVGNNHYIGINSTGADILIATGLPAVYGLVHNALRSMSRSNTASALEGVLAQDQLSAPEPPVVEAPHEVLD